MQTKSENPPLQYKPNIDKLIRKLRIEVHEEKERTMTTNQAQTLMDYLTPTLGNTNPILLPELLEWVTFDFKHEFLQMLENNLFSGAAHKNHMHHLSASHSSRVWMLHVGVNLMLKPLANAIKIIEDMCSNHYKLRG